MTAVRWGARLEPGLALVVAALLWEAAGRWLEFRFLPPFSVVLARAGELLVGGQLVSYLLVSLSSLTLGYGLAVVCGLVLGVLMGRFRTVALIADPYVSLFLATPNVVFVPLLFALFGVGRGAQVVIIFLAAFFTIVVSTMNGVRTVDGAIVEMARAYGASERQLFWKVLLPAALPLSMAGLRVGMGRGLRAMINGEMFIAVFGLGGLLRTYGSRFDAERVWAILLVVVGVALLLTGALQWLERRTAAWTHHDA